MCCHKENVLVWLFFLGEAYNFMNDHCRYYISSVKLSNQFLANNFDVSGLNLKFDS